MHNQTNRKKLAHTQKITSLASALNWFNKLNVRICLIHSSIYMHTKWIDPSIKIHSIANSDSIAFEHEYAWRRCTYTRKTNSQFSLALALRSDTFLVLIYLDGIMFEVVYRLFVLFSNIALVNVWMCWMDYLFLFWLNFGNELMTAERYGEKELDFQISLKQL